MPPPAPEQGQEVEASVVLQQRVLEAAVEELLSASFRGNVQAGCSPSNECHNHGCPGSLEKPESADPNTGAEHTWD